MARDYAVVSKNIAEHIGGVENIASVTHCMTRLRFVLKDESGRRRGCKSLTA